jgi:hypothetical protein
MSMNPRLLRPLAQLRDELSLWIAEMFPNYWHWSN